MSQGINTNNATKVVGLRDANAKLRRERDALQQQVYDLAARNAHLENEIAEYREQSFEIIHDLNAQLDRARARRRG